LLFRATVGIFPREVLRVHQQLCGNETKSPSVI
jgi:hypothetical protein